MYSNLFTVAIVGRANVGKSSLFNALLGYRRSIVLDFPGTTMDEVSEIVEWDLGPLRLIDSQGVFEEPDKDALGDLLKKADACIFVVDAHSGPTPFDRALARTIHGSGVAVLLCVNKIDGNSAEAPESFGELAFDEALGVSAAHRTNFPELREWILNRQRQSQKHFNSGAVDQIEEVETEAKPPVEKITVALVGKPNTGKSTLMNRLCQTSVSRVSPKPLTTRDPVVYDLSTPEGEIHLVDTAGIRRPRSDKEQVEVFSIQASTRAIRSADVVFLLIACHEAVSDQDMRLLSLLESEGKPALVLLNFWDQLGVPERKHFVDDSDFASRLSEFNTLPISGKTGFNTQEALRMAWKLARGAKKRIKTSQLNRIVERIVSKNPPPASGNGNFNILYASQIDVQPPTFVFFLNRKEQLPSSYQRYLMNSLRKELRFKGQTIRVFFRGSSASYKERPFQSNK